MLSWLIPMLDHRSNHCSIFIFLHGEQFLTLVPTLNFEFKRYSRHTQRFLCYPGWSQCLIKDQTIVQFSNFCMGNNFLLQCQPWILSLVDIPDILKDFNAILVDPNAWSKLKPCFNFHIFAWGTIFDFSPNLKFWI